ncbi:MAG: aminodeoxychorismate lyase [Wenzhouxiangella sp.]|nr:aminodeoxychorismate lyase [Wenzhouxiangella sp.]
MNRTLVDGREIDSVPADDRALLYGDGLFETIAFIDGQAPLWPRHWQRFSESCERLGLDCPDQAGLLEDCRRLAPDAGQVVIRFLLSRGSGGRAYWPPEPARPRLIVQSRSWPESLARQRREGLNLVSSRIRLASASMLAGIKHCNRLEQVLAARHCALQGADEAVLFDGRERLVEAIASNLILDLDDGLVTPWSEAGVRGVGLGWLQDCGLALTSQVIDRAALNSARSIVVVNSVAGPRLARSLDGQSLAATPACQGLIQTWQTRLW